MPPICLYLGNEMKKVDCHLVCQRMREGKIYQTKINIFHVSFFAPIFLPTPLVQDQGFSIRAYKISGKYFKNLKSNLGMYTNVGAEHDLLKI